MAKNLFLDANILLSFYGLNPAELEELRKLVALIDSNQLVLWLPEQTRDEVRRNREKVLAEATKPMREARLNVPLPWLSKGMQTRTPMEHAVKAVQVAHANAMEEIDAAIANCELDADRVIEELIMRAQNVPTGGLVQVARDRRDRRMPPGKSDSLGDAINWEAILSGVPPDEDIHLVSGDPDFRSPLPIGGLSEYLTDEYAKRHGGSAVLYKDLEEFSSRHFPDIKLASDVPKMQAIDALAASGSFSSTHSAVANLLRFDLFSPAQARLLIKAAAHNSQVRWIATDADVARLLDRVIEAHRPTLDPLDLAILDVELNPKATTSGAGPGDVDLPF